MVFFIEGVEVLEITCGEEYGISNDLCLACSTLQKSIKQYYTSKIISKLIKIGVFVPIYSSMLFQFLGAPLKLHKF